LNKLEKKYYKNVLDQTTIINKTLTNEELKVKVHNRRYLLNMRKQTSIVI